MQDDTSAGNPALFFQGPSTFQNGIFISLKALLNQYLLLVRQTVRIEFLWEGALIYNNIDVSTLPAIRNLLVCLLGVVLVSPSRSSNALGVHVPESCSCLETKPWPRQVPTEGQHALSTLFF